MIKSFDVQKIGSAVWAIHLTPAHCGTNIDKITIVDAVRVRRNASNDVTTYRPVNHTSSSLVTVTRDQKATPPIGGTFDIVFQGKELSGTTSRRLIYDFTISLYLLMCFSNRDVLQYFCSGSQISSTNELRYRSS